MNRKEQLFILTFSQVYGLNTIVSESIGLIHMFTSMKSGMNTLDSPEIISFFHRRAHAQQVPFFSCFSIIPDRIHPIMPVHGHEFSSIINWRTSSSWSANPCSSKSISKIRVDLTVIFFIYIKTLFNRHKLHEEPIEKSRYLAICFNLHAPRLYP